MSTLAIEAKVTNQARTSANSSARFLRSRLLSARDSSPTSSANHMNVSASPRSRSRAP